MSVNKIILVGNLGNDPEIKEFSNGGKQAVFSLATSERAFTTKEGQNIPQRTQWHQIILNGKMADVANKYLFKGNKVYLEGILRYRKYTDSNNIERYVSEIFATNLQMLTPKSSDDKQTENRPPENPFDGDNDELPF